MFILALELCVFLFLVFAVWTQVIRPTMLGQKLFPYFRAQQSYQKLIVDELEQKETERLAEIVDGLRKEEKDSE